MKFLVEIREIKENKGGILILFLVCLILIALPFYLGAKNSAEKDVPIVEVEYDHTEYGSDLSGNKTPNFVYYKATLKTNKFKLRNVSVKVVAYYEGQEISSFTTTLTDIDEFDKNSTYDVLIHLRANSSGSVDSFYWDASKYSYKATVTSSKVAFWMGNYSLIYY